MSKFNENFLALLESRRESKKYLTDKKDKWNFDNEEIVIFEDFFKEVLSGKKIQELVNSLKKYKGSVRAINLFGGTKALEDLGVDSGFSVRLKKQHPSKEGFEVIEGNLLSRKTWKKIPRNLDLIISMGRGALYDLPDSIDASYFLINNAWKKMDSNGSIALFQVPRFMENEFKQWVEAVSNSGIFINYSLTKGEKDTYFAVLIVKDQKSPNNLPTISESNL